MHLVWKPSKIFRFAFIRQGIKKYAPRKGGLKMNSQNNKQQNDSLEQQQKEKQHKEIEPQKDTSKPQEGNC